MPLLDYLQLRMTFEAKQNDAYPVRAESTEGAARGTLRLPTADPAFTQMLAQLAAMKANRDTLLKIGQTLFAALFQGEIRQVYDRVRGRVSATQGIRLVLSFDRDESEIAALPWEFLCEPDSTRPLALRDVSIVRDLAQLAPVPSLKADLPLKVLLTGAATTPRPDVDAALGAVQTALAGLGDRVQLTVEPHLTRRKLQPLLRENFHVWHFIGHGSGPTDGSPGALRFELPGGDENDYDEYSADELSIIFDRNSIRLVVLNACNSATLDTDPFLSLAPALIEAQIPGVIAMQFKVAETSAQSFSEEFYAALAQGFPLDVCVTEGRRRVMSDVGLAQPDWGIPVVYTRAQDGRLFDLPNAASVTIADSSPASSAPATVNPPQDNSEDIAALMDQFNLSKRRYYELMKQQAAIGINTDPYIRIQIEDLTKEFKQIAGQIQALGGTPPDLRFLR